MNRQIYSPILELRMYTLHPGRRDELIRLFEREFVEAEQAAYLETAAEDDEIAERMDAGRRALYKAGRSEEGPYQSPLEDGMQHFHEFLRRELDVQPAPVNARPCSTR